MSRKLAVGALVAASVVGAFAADEMLITEEVKAELTREIKDFELDFTQFESWTVKEFKKLLGANLAAPHDLPVVNYDNIAEFVTIPDSFDATANSAWDGCIHPIRDQMKCGSCWAFSASEVLSDRTCIASNGATNVVLSPEDMVQCDGSNSGCGGGQLAAAWSYLENTGIVSDSCMPYTSGDGTTGSCPNKCADGSNFLGGKHHAKKGSSANIKGEASIQMSIMTYGPVQTGFYVYKSFTAYKSGVYKKGLFEFIPLGGHAVKIVGWGVENGVKYWKVANSWNTSWGENGYFRIIRGTNSCDIESQVFAGLADV